MRKQTAYAFFLKQAGYSYDPKAQTRIKGKRESAKRLAAAETWARENDVTFDWQEDDQPFECACDDPTCESHEPHTAYVCLARDASGTVQESLCGISFGPCVDPWRHPYKRVVEAELALEMMPE